MFEIPPKTLPGVVGHAVGHIRIWRSFVPSVRLSASVRSSNPRSPHLLSCPVLSRPSKLQQPLSVNEISSRPPTFHSLTHSKFSKFLSRAGRSGRMDGRTGWSRIHTFTGCGIVRCAEMLSLITRLIYTLHLFIFVSPTVKFHAILNAPVAPIGCTPNASLLLF